MNMQQPPLGTSHLILGRSVVTVLPELENLVDHCSDGMRRRHSSQLYRMMELMNPGRIVDTMILIGTNNVSRSSDAEETQWE